MSYFMKSCFFLIFIATNVQCFAVDKDIFFVDRILTSNNLVTTSSNPLLPGESVEDMTVTDELINYVAIISVINPTKKTYDIEIICTDSKNNIIFKGVVKKSINEYLREMGKDKLKGITITFRLDPKRGAMIKGQRIPLIVNEDYFIKLYFEKKLIGITQFHYYIP